MTFTSFLRAEDGAVTVDWVVMTAALVGLGLAVTAVVSGGVDDLSGDASDNMTNIELSSSFGAVVAAGLDLVGYTPFAATHGASWGNNGIDALGRNWAQSAYEGWSTLSDAQLIAMYTQDYAWSMSGTGEFNDQRVDYIAVQEQIMLERGITIPEGNMTAEEVRELRSV